MKALILAGGFATRLWPLTIDKAKPLLPISDKPIISHIVEKIPSDIPVIVSTNAVFESDFRAWRDTHPERDITIFIEDSSSDKGKKGALAAIALVIQKFNIEEDLLMIGGDNFFQFSLPAFLDRFDGRPLLAACDIRDIEEAKKYGVVVADGTDIVDFQEKPNEPKSTLAGTCCYLFPKEHLTEIVTYAGQHPDKLGGIFEHYLAIGANPQVFTFIDYWNDIGSFRAYIDTHVFTGKTSVPQKFCDPSLNNTFEGVNYIDQSCVIENATIKNSIIMPGTIIKNGEIDSCIIDRDCELENIDLMYEIVKQGTVVLN